MQHGTWPGEAGDFSSSTLAPGEADEFLLTQASAPATPHLSVAPLRPGVVNTMSTELAQTPAW